MAISKSGPRIAILGCGKIGEALAGGLIASGFTTRGRLRATTHRRKTAVRVSERLKLRVDGDNCAAVRNAEVIILALKPAKTRGVCEEIAESLPANALVISLATGVPTALLERWLPPKTAIVRAMPNTPILIREGMTVVCGGRRATKAHLKLCEKLFTAVGQVVIVEEELMNAATGLSAGGPAYVYVIIESLAEAGVKVGMPRDLATQLAAQAVRGASSLVLDSGMHPALLKDHVTTPAGVTIDGLMELEAGGLRVALLKAIVTSTKRAREIEERLIKEAWE
jgi:pyrroline-5-carboxylate reductase